MDATTEKLIDYTMSVSYDDLPPGAVEACKRRVLDTLGCVAGAYDHPVSIAARKLAAGYRMDRPATVLGCRTPTAPEMAAFANGVMLRVLDLNDMYRVKSGGHPSDIMAAAFAAAELGSRDGKSLIAAIATGYEVYCSCCDGIDLNSQGWDQPVYGVVAAFLAAGRLLGLDRQRLGHGLALALVPNMALFETRQGQLSSWKGCAAANASRNAVFAALLAQAGFTGADAPIEGKSGLWNAVGRFEWPLEIGRPPYRIGRTHLKCFPICYHGQSAVSAALSLRGELRVEDIEAVRIETYRTAVQIMANDPSRWSPETRETADHSLPYVVCTALLDGAVDEASFSEARIRDAGLASLLARTSVSEDASLTAQYPESSPSRITLRLKNGSELRNEVRYPSGHHLNPMTDAEVEDKFTRLFGRYGSERRSRRVIALVNRLEQLDDVAELLAGFARRAGECGSAAISKDQVGGERFPTSHSMCE